jgi:lysyl-tRNA synthetase class I
MQEFEKLITRTNNWIVEINTILEDEKDPKIKKEIMRKLELFNIPEEIDEGILNKMDENQIKGIHLLKEYLENNEGLSADSIQNKLFSIAKEDLDLKPRKFFELIYQIILGKKSGPRLGPFLSLLDRSWLLRRLDI